MKPSLICKDHILTVEQNQEMYPYPEYIINTNVSSTSNCELVTWLFPNQELVQLLFYSPDDAEIFHISPSLVLPEEGQDGFFFTQGEIHLFLTRIKNESH